MHAHTHMRMHLQVSLRIIHAYMHTCILRSACASYMHTYTHAHTHAHMHPQVGLRIMKLRMHAHTRTCTHASSGRPAHHEAADDRQRPARGLQASQVSPPQVQDPRAKAAQVRPAVEVHAYMAVDLCICGGGSMHMWRWIYAWSRRWRSNGAAAHGSRWCGTVELEVHWWAFQTKPLFWLYRSSHKWQCSLERRGGVCTALL